jgi:hypothetical protein
MNTRPNAHACDARRARWGVPAACVALAIGTVGCLQIDTTIRLNEDGSGTVTERLRFSRELLDADRTESGVSFEFLLARQNAEKRVARMGKGARLAAHSVQNSELASRESVAVFEIPDLTDLRYPSVLVGVHVPAWDMQIKIREQLNDDWRGWGAGRLRVHFDPCAPPPTPVSTNAAAAPPPKLPPGPAGRQVYRDLTPTFRELLKGFRIRVAFEAYGRITHWMDDRGFARKRGFSSPERVSLIDYTYAGDTGTEALDNEEIMADLLLFHLSGDNNNSAYGPFLSPLLPKRRGLQVEPSLPLFKKYFEGKTLNYDLGFGKRRVVEASFESIGSRDVESRRNGKRDGDKDEQPKTP